MENNKKDNIKNDNKTVCCNIDNNNIFINSNNVENAYYNGLDIKHNKTQYMPINKYICVNYDFTKKIVTKATGDGNCLFNLLSSLIFNTEKYHNILRRFLCNKLETDKEMKELGEKYLKDYVNKMEQNSVFGEYSIVNIFSKIFNIPVQIVDTSNNKYYDINYNKNTVNFLKIYYNGVNHYSYGISTLTDQQIKPIIIAIKNFITFLKNKNKVEIDAILKDNKDEKVDKNDNKDNNKDEKVDKKDNKDNKDNKKDEKIDKKDNKDNKKDEKIDKKDNKDNKKDEKVDKKDNNDNKDNKDNKNDKKDEKVDKKDNNDNKDNKNDKKDEKVDKKDSKDNKDNKNDEKVDKKDSKDNKDNKNDEKVDKNDNKDNKNDKKVDKNIKEACCVKECVERNNVFDICKKISSNTNNLCNQSTLTLFLIGLLIYDIFLKNNNQIILLQNK